MLGFSKIRRQNGIREIHFVKWRIWQYGQGRPSRIVCVGGVNEVKNLPPHVRVNIYGADNAVRFEDSSFPFYGEITIGADDCPVSGCRVFVGKNCSAAGVAIVLMEDNSSVNIGADCMFSREVEIYASDTHAILDRSGIVVNATPSHIEIGDHVWLGFGATVLKGARIAKDSIVGMRAVVTASLNPEVGAVYVGNPARIVKQGMNWSRERPQNYSGALT